MGKRERARARGRAGGREGGTDGRTEGGRAGGRAGGREGKTLGTTRCTRLPLSLSSHMVIMLKAALGIVCAVEMTQYSYTDVLCCLSIHRAFRAFSRSHSVLC